MDIETFFSTNKTDEDYDRKVKLILDIKAKNEKSTDSLDFRIANNGIVIPFNATYLVVIGLIVICFSLGLCLLIKLCRKGKETVRAKEDNISIYNNICSAEHSSYLLSAPKRSTAPKETEMKEEWPSSYKRTVSCERDCRAGQTRSAPLDDTRPTRRHRTRGQNLSCKKNGVADRPL